MPTPDVPAGAICLHACSAGPQARDRAGPHRRPRTRVTTTRCGTVPAGAASYYLVNLRSLPKVRTLPFRTTQDDARRPEGAP
jgi:hypothetical protein